MLSKWSPHCFSFKSSLRGLSSLARSQLLDRSKPKAQPYSLFWELINIPSAKSLHVFHHNFKTGEVESSHSVKANVQKDECPFEEGVDCVSCPWSAMASRNNYMFLFLSPPATL
jgi:hypothetical protein